MMLGGYEVPGILIYCWWEYTKEYQVLRPIWQFLIKLNTHPNYNPAISFLSIFFSETHIHKEPCTKMLLAVLFI